MKGVSCYDMPFFHTANLFHPQLRAPVKKRETASLYCNHSSSLFPNLLKKTKGLV